ncbi:MAG: hypothetical protein RL670_613 [Actinomycetota bacterium]
MFVSLFKVYSLTLKADKGARLKVAIGFVLPIVLGVVAANTFGATNLFSQISWYVCGVMGGVLASMILLNRPAEKAQFARFEGQPGATTVVLQSLLKRAFRGSEEPVGVNPRTRDMVFRIVGGPGIVVIAEGQRSSVSNLVEEQRRIAQKVANGVPFHVVYIGTGEHQVRLGDARPHIMKMKRELNRREITETVNRLGSMSLKLPIPKGIDPTKVRAPRR